MKISVVIPCYNAELYVEQTIRSVFNQVFDSFEIIAVNDGSTDNTGAILEKLALETNRLHVIHKTNGGEASAFKAGIDISRGEFIVRIDSDDLMMPNRLALQYEWMIQNRDIDVSGSWFIICDEHGLEKSQVCLPCEPSHVLFFMCFFNQIANPTTISKKAIIRGLDIPNFKIGADLFVWLKILSNGGKVANQPINSTLYRKHRLQVTHQSNTSNIQASTLAVYELFSHFFSNTEIWLSTDMFYEGSLWRSGSIGPERIFFLLQKFIPYDEGLALLSKIGLLYAIFRLINGCNATLVMKLLYLLRVAHRYKMLRLFPYLLAYKFFQSNRRHQL